MTIRYSRRALRQLDAILSYISDESPAGAASVQRRLKEVIDLLEQRPLLGRALKRPGLRRAVVSPYPYLVFYRASRDGVIILSIRHAARRPMPNLS